jgi:hypothetical protein
MGLRSLDVSQPLPRLSDQRLNLLPLFDAEDLARESSLSVATVRRRAELTESETSMTTANDSAIRRALEAAGVEFIDENGGGPGVRLRKSVGRKSGK